MKILLLSIPREGEVLDYTTRDYLLTEFYRYPPLGLMSLTAEVDRSRHLVELIDASTQNYSIEETVALIAERQPDVLGLSVVTRRLWAMHEIARRAHEVAPGVRVVAGGPHVNYWPRETMELRSVDYCLPGFGEKTFPALIQALEAGGELEDLAKVHNLYWWAPSGELRHNPAEPARGRILDDVPFADRSLVNLRDYFTAVDREPMTTTYSSRGCPFSCLYCDVQEKQFLYRSAKNMVDEFEIVRDMGIKEIHIFDDVFNIRRERIMELCDEIERRNVRIRWSIRARVNPWDQEMLLRIKKAGCHRIHVGVESLDPRTLAYMNKKQSLEHIQAFFRMCKVAKIETLAYFMIGFPTETKAYHDSLYDEVMKLEPSYAFFNILYPLAKTQYYQSLLDDGTYDRDHWAEFLRNPTPNFELPLPRSVEAHRQLEDLADQFHRRFCYRMKFLWKEFFRSLRYPRMLLIKTRLAFVLVWETIFWRRRAGAATRNLGPQVQVLHEAGG